MVTRFFVLVSTLWNWLWNDSVYWHSADTFLNWDISTEILKGSTPSWSVTDLRTLNSIKTRQSHTSPHYTHLQIQYLLHTCHQALTTKKVYAFGPPLLFESLRPKKKKKRGKRNFCLHKLIWISRMLEWLVIPMLCLQFLGLSWPIHGYP